MRIFLLLLPIFLFAKTVTVSIAPQQWIIEHIAPDLEVEVLLPKSASPATYSPKPSDLAALKRSELYFTIGVPFERANLKRFATLNSKMKIVDMSRYVRKFPIAHHHKHAHESLDPHTWLAPPQLMLLARAALQELIKLEPAKKESYLKNYEELIKKLAAFDAKIFKLTLTLRNRKFLVYHPSFGYFARVYDLEQIAIEKEGKEPSAAHLTHLVHEAKGAKVLIIEPQFPKRSAQLLAKKLGLTIVTIDPLAPNPLQTIQKVTDALRR
jgi:zinc transport system substrate-binding protein